MKLAGGALNKVVNRPFLLIFSALFSLVYTVVDILNPITAIAFGFISIGNGDMLGSSISLLQAMLSPKLFLTVGKWVLPGIGILTLIISPLLSGYFYILNNTLMGYQKQDREFFTGMKMYFIKLFRVTLTAFLAGFALILFISVIIIPALFTTWSWRAGKPELMSMAVFLNIVTAVVVFFVIMFFEIYILYWYPSVYSFNVKTFLQGKITIDQSFWLIFGRWILIDLIFIIFELLFLFLRYRISLGGEESPLYTSILFACKFIITSTFFTCVTTFTFASFISVKE